MTLEIMLAGGLAACCGGLVVSLVKIARLKKAAKKSARAVKQLQAKRLELAHRSSAQSLTILWQQDQIDALAKKVSQQKRLLDQKWVAAHAAYEEGKGNGGRR